MKKILLTVLISLASVAAFAQDGEINVRDTTYDGLPLTTIDQMPSFPGGSAGLSKFLSNNIRYPEEARKRNIQGKVILRFVVGRQGEIEQVLVLRDIGGGCGEEAKRVVSAMPRWEPGRQNKIPVRVFYTMPVNFSLGD